MAKKLFLLALVLFLTGSFCFADKTVEVVGRGISEGEAKKDALRNAVEQGVGVRIFSESEVKDFVAIKDVIISESFGLVKEFTVIYSRKLGEDDWEVKIRATVTKDVKNQWDKIKLILKQQGKPKIMFCLNEKLDGNPLFTAIGEYQLREKFKDLGFEVVDRQWSKKTRDLQKQVYSMDQNMNGVTAVASQMGADFIVIGVLECNFNGYKDFYGMKYIFHNYSFSVKVINTSTSRVVASLNEVYSTKLPLMTTTRENAAKAGYNQIISEEYVKPLMTKITKDYIESFMQGAEMTIVISDVKFSRRKKVINTLKNLPDLITSVQIEHYRNRRLQLRVKSKVNMETLAEKMEEIPGLSLEVSEFKPSWLELKLVK